jgi:PAS domain S-box-containing protein
MLTDITDRRRAQREVESKNEEIVTIFERVNDAFSAFDHEWRFTYLNREAESILGRSREELLGKCLWDEFEGARETLVYQEYTRAVREQVTASFEVFYGPLRGWFEVHAYPSPSGMSAYFRNVTERKLAELEREKAAEEKSRLLAELQQAAVRQRRFLREMLSSLTEGRLCLCDAPEDLPPLLPESEPQVDLAKRTLRALRAQVEAMAGTIGLERERVHDFVTAVGEASMNAVVHAGGGTGQVQFDKEAGVLRVWIRDQGKGIAEDAIHRATLERGFSSSGTLGHGFWMMLKTADYIYLLTTPTGTTVVLEQRRFPMEPAWLQAIYK